MRAVKSPSSSGVDVAIVMYGGTEFLPACFDALRAQGNAVGRVIVIDNAASAETARILNANAAALVVNDTNLGYAAAMNQAYALSSAPFLLSLNADCALAPGYIAACLEEMHAHPRAAGVTGVLRLPDGRIDSSGIAVTRDGRAADRDRHADEASAGDPFGISGAAALWRRDALASVGPEPWWSFLFVYWEDVEIAFRLRSKGWTFRCATAAHATHRRGSDTAEPDFIESQSLRNRIATLARHRGAAGLAAPATAGQLLGTVARLAARHPQALRQAAPLTALRAGLRQRRADSFTA